MRLRAPSFYSLDAALSKTFGLKLGESWKITLRAEAFNVLNHIGLDRPANDLTGANFGVALFGRHGMPPSFPALAPLDETPRRIRLGVLVSF